MNTSLIQHAQLDLDKAFTLPGSRSFGIDYHAAGLFRLGSGKYLHARPHRLLR